MARTSNNTFMGMDVPNFMDFTKFADFTKFTEQFKVPTVDTEALLDSQRKNIEAFSAANRIAFEGAQAVTQRQVEILRQVMEESAAVVKQLTAAGKPEDKLADQAELLKHTYEQSVANFRELAEMGAKSNGEAVEVLSRRVTEGLDELKTALKQVTTVK
jgi:phasin family protein